MFVGVGEPGLSCPELISGGELDSKGEPMHPSGEPRQPIWCWNPRLRVREQQSGDERVAVLEIPDTGDYFQLGWPEYAIARAFDTGRGIVEVQAIRSLEGDTLEKAELEEFVAECAAAGILVRLDIAPERPDRPQAPPPRRRRLGSLLQIQLPAFDAAPFFDRTYRFARPLASPSALGSGILLVFAALGVFAGHRGEIWASMRASWGGATLFATWLLYAAVVLVHELAHGYACVHFGGRVRTLGFMLLYGKPCAYCDVSDAWMLPKGPRIAVMAAGSLVELALWALATLAWRITAPETAAHQASLVLMAICGIGTLFNFNPLLKFDGYYMLSDGLGIPNLRQRAFDHLKAVLRRRPTTDTPREKRIFRAYGLLALAYSALVLGYLLFRLHGWVAVRWGGSGLLVLWGTVIVTAVRPWGRRLGFAAFATVTRRSRTLAWLGSSLVAVALLAFVRWPLKVAAESHLEPRARTVVRSALAGVVESVDVRQGDLVTADQVLGRLATRDLDFALEAAKAEVRELEARLALVRSGARAQEIEMARQRAAASETRRSFDARAYERARQSLEGDLVSRQSVELAERQLRLAEDEERTTKKALELLLAGSRPEEIRAMESRLEAAASDAARLEDERRRTSILAPHPGQILTAHVERLAGRSVERGDSLFVVADQSTMVLEIPVSEKDVDDVRVGARVRFKSRSLPRRVFEGEVVEISPVAVEGERQRTVLVRSWIENPEGLLRADTSGFAKISCGNRRLGALLLRRGVRSLRTEFWALW